MHRTASNRECTASRRIARREAVGEGARESISLRIICVTTSTRRTSEEISTGREVHFRDVVPRFHRVTSDNYRNSCQPVMSRDNSIDCITNFLHDSYDCIAVYRNICVSNILQKCTRLETLLSTIFFFLFTLFPFTTSHSVEFNNKKFHDRNGLGSIRVVKIQVACPTKSLICSLRGAKMRKTGGTATPPRDEELTRGSKSAERRTSLARSKRRKSRPECSGPI